MLGANLHCMSASDSHADRRSREEEIEIARHRSHRSSRAPFPSSRYSTESKREDAQDRQETATNNKGELPFSDGEQSSTGATGDAGSDLGGRTVLQTYQHGWAPPACAAPHERSNLELRTKNRRSERCKS